MTDRGYFGIGIYHTKTAANVGTLWRSAYILGAGFIFTIGARYPKQASDTVKAYRHIPLHEYKTWPDFIDHVPYDCQVVCVEMDERAKNLTTYVHPERCVYVLGAEDEGIPANLLAGKTVIQLPSVRDYCHNVAVAGALVMQDRLTKTGAP